MPPSVSLLGDVLPLIPDRTTTELLRAMLLDGEAAREAWTRWTHAVHAPKTALADDARTARLLLPLLCDSMRRNALPADDETATYLRSAYLRESLRSRAYRAIVAEVAALLAGTPFQFVKGAAVGEEFYAEPALRHAHDIEIFVADEPAVRAALSGYHRDGRQWIHHSGLPLRVHTRLLGSTYRPLDATDALALALTCANRSYRWVCDAYLIVRSGKADPERLPFRKQLAWLRATF
jgi:hypothetical protein